MLRRSTAARYTEGMSTASIAYEQTLPGFSPPSALGPHRAADYWELPEGEPVELIYGRLIVSPSPNLLHQAISLVLSEFLLKSSRQGGGRAVAAPADVTLADHSIVQPDLLYIAKERREIAKSHVEGPPDLVIEILSPSNTRRDRLEKMQLYAESGVAEYWIVDPEERHFEFYLNRDGKYEVQPQRDDKFTSPRLPELAINLADFWQEVAKQVG